LAIPRARGPIIIFTLPGLVFGDIEGAGSSFHVLCSRTHFRRYRKGQAQFSYFVLPFSMVLRVSSPVSMFYTPKFISNETEGRSPDFMLYARRIIFDGTKGVRFQFSYFVLPNHFSVVPRALGSNFHGTEGVVSHCQVLRFRTHFR
jgi:hypothetical protein